MHYSEREIRIDLPPRTHVETIGKTEELYDKSELVQKRRKQKLTGGGPAPTGPRLAVDPMQCEIRSLSRWEAEIFAYRLKSWKTTLEAAR